MQDSFPYPAGVPLVPGNPHGMVFSPSRSKPVAGANKPNPESCATIFKKDGIPGAGKPPPSPGQRRLTVCCFQAGLCQR